MTTDQTDLSEMLRLLITDERRQYRPARFEVDAILAMFKEHGLKTTAKPLPSEQDDVNADEWWEEQPDYLGAPGRGGWLTG